MKQLTPYLFSFIILMLCQTAQAQTSTSKTEIFEYVEQMPEFPQGEDSMLHYIGTHTKYPLKALEVGIKGKVFVNFTVNTLGEIINVSSPQQKFECPKNVNLNSFPNEQKSLIDEAIRVISTMPKWKPGYQQGKAVNVSYKIPITFDYD